MPENTERRQQGGVVEEIEEVIEGEMAEASASPSDNKNSARGSKADQSAMQSAMQSAVSAVHQERNSAPLSTGKTGKAKAQKKDSEITSASNVEHPSFTSVKAPQQAEVPLKQNRSRKGESEETKVHKQEESQQEEPKVPGSNSIKDKKEQETQKIPESNLLKLEKKRQAGLKREDPGVAGSRTDKHRASTEEKKRKETEKKQGELKAERKKPKQAPSPSKAELQKNPEEDAARAKQLQDSEIEKKRKQDLQDARRVRVQEQLLLRQLNLTDDQEDWMHSYLQNLSRNI